MMKKKKNLLNLILLINLFFLAACSTVQPQDYAGRNTSENTQEVQVTDNITKEILGEWIIPTGSYEIKVVKNNTIYSIYHCGSVAYGPVVNQKIEEIIESSNVDDVYTTHLIINNYSKDYIGACPEIIRNGITIDFVHFYPPIEKNYYYDEILLWLEPSKVIYEEG